MAQATEPVRAHALAGVAHAVGAPQSSELGFGTLGQVGLELPLSSVFGVQAGLAALFLADGSPPRDPRLSDRSSAFAPMAFAGVRVEGPRGGPWADLDLGLAASSGARFAFDAHAGWDFVVGRGQWHAGPMLGYLHVVQPDDALRPEDGHALSLGAHVSFGNSSGPCADADRDGICDEVDACVDVPGQSTSDPKTHGCPRLDRDAVVDAPRGDRDHDAVFDDEDACPDVPGVRSEDPKKNGCPRLDRDNDTVLDDEDACPDVPGVRSTDPKTNGCPPSAGPVRVEGDRIVLDEVIRFDLNSPRVRHVSWPLVQKIANFINGNPDILEIDIEGHADRLGTEAHNLQLSKERANAVQKLLVKYGVDGSRVTAKGFGEARPISKRRTQAAPEDRRVEFWVVRARPAQAAPRPGGQP